MPRKIAILFLLTPFIVLSLFVCNNSLAAPFSELYKQTQPSVVTVFTQNSEGKVTGQGSGVSVLNGLVVTNCHVLKGARYILLSNGDKIAAATIWGGLPEEDICLLQPITVQFPSARIGDPAVVSVGDEIFTIGSPVSQELTMSVGIISQIRANGKLLQTNAAMSVGSSGGGMFNSAGELIGITTYVMDNAQNINFSITASLIQMVQKGPVIFSTKTVVHAADLAPTYLMLGIAQ